MAAFSLKIPINYLILKTVFKQFCGGQTVSDSKNVISKNWKYHVASILDYSVEGQIDELGFDQTQKSIIETIDLSKNNSGVPLAVFKVTGLVKASLLQKVSSGMNLTKNDLASWQKGLERIDEILAHAYSLDVPIMIDAEESWIQNAVDDIARRGMELYNKKDVIVYNMIQCYKTGQLSLLKKNTANILSILFGSLLIAILAQVSIIVPFTPVPITGQTIGVVLLGGLLGSRKAAIAVTLYLMEGALGLPVFANMKSGAHILVGPTAGYLWGFIPAAFLTGLLAEKGFIKSLYSSYAVCFLTTTLILVSGTIYLSVFGMGIEKALNLGFYPFLIGDVIKSGITAGLIISFRKFS